MDSSWQGKCGSAFQSSVPTMASSSSKEARDQMEMNSGHWFYPYAGQDLRFQIHGRKPDPTFPSFNSFSSCSSTLTDLSSSFLALLSEPATLSQFGIQELSNPQLFNPTTGMVNQICSVAGTPVGHQVPLASMRPSKIISYQNPQGGNVLYPTVSSSAKACPSFGSSSVFEGSHPAVNTSRQGSDLAKTTIHHTVFGNEKEKDFHSLEEGVDSVSLGNGVKIQNANHQMLQKVPVEVKCFASNNSSNSNSGSPRVFCLDKSGNLLLSNTGLLGILCSCHCIHMSVSRFCEHSGLWDANPGDSIRMGSGETIAQWRKLYFQRCGIRIPEDQSGWEWPEGLSLTANLMKSAVPMSNMLKHSECSNLVGPSDDLLRSGWPLGDVSPNNFLVNKSLVADDRHNKQQRSVKDCNKRYLDGFVGNSRNNSCHLGDNYMTEHPTSRCLTMPKFAARGPENICQSLYLDSVVENGGPSTTHPALQDKKNLVRDFAVSRDQDVHEISGIDKVASSSIELKLGQPMQQSHCPGNPVIGPLCYNTTVNPLKSFPQGQNIHNVIGCMVEEQSGAHVPDAVGLSNYTRRREQDCLNYANYAHQNTNGNKAKSSAGSLFGRNTLPEGSSQSIATKLLNVNEHVVRETQHYHSANCNSSDAPVDDGNILDRQYLNHGSRICKLADMGKGIGYLTGNSCVQAASVSKLQKWMQNTSCSTEVVKGNNLCVSPPMHDESRYSMCSSNMPPDASDAENFLESLQKVHYRGSSGYTDRVFFRPKCSPGGYTQNLSSKGIPMGSAPNPTPEFLAAMAHQDSNGRSSYSLDDSLTMLTSGQILELCKKQHVMSSLGNNLEQEKSSDTYNVKIQHSFVEPSILEEQRHVPNLIRKHDVSEMAMKMKLDHSVPPSTKLKDDKKVTSMTGFSRWCNNSASNLGVPQKYDEFGTHHQLSQNPLHNKQSSFRLSGSQSSIYSAAHGSFYQTTHCCQCDCSCVSRTNCLGRKCNTIGGNCPNSLRNQTGNMSCKTPILIASPCVNDHSVPKENAISFNQCGRINRQLPKNVNCGGSQWNDFTSQVKGFSELACIKQSANMLDGTRHELFKFGDTAAKYSNGTVHAADSFKELDVSNISSGCSTPAVSQASIDVANVDSSTNVGDTGCTDNLAVDEGSTIDKCWSSDDAIESDRSSNFYGCKSKQRRHTSSKVTSHNSTRDLLEEVKLMDFLAWKKGQNLKQAGNAVHWKSNQSQETEKSFKPVKRKREIKLKKLDLISGTEVPLLDGEGSECGRISDWHCLSKNVQLGSCGPESSRKPVAHSTKINPDHENSKMTVTKALARERDFLKNSDAGDCDNDHEIEVNCANSCEKLGSSGRKKLRSYQTAGICVQLRSHESTEAVGEQTVMYDSENRTKTYSSQHVSYCDRKAKPVVCGKYGEITNGNMGEDLLERVKIVSLDWVLKTAKRCSLPKRHKSEPTSSKVLNRTTFGRSNACHDKSSILTKGRKIRSSDALMCEEVNNHISMEERDDTSTDDDEQYGDDFSMVGKKCHGSGKGCIIQETTPHARLRRKHKETRKRSLYELMLRGNNPDSKLVSQKKFKCAPKMKWEDILQNSDEIPDHKSREVRREQRHNSVIESDLCCCVCGSSNEDEVDRLLECCQCSIRVHQACYGVSKVPKGPWYCRPCRTNSKNIVCVLCGYGGGAMTRAFQCHTFVKSLLKAWNLESECRPKNAISSAEALPDEQSMLHASVSIPGNNSFDTVRPINSKLSTSSICKMDAYNQFGTSENSLSNVSDLKVHNSITAGVCDSTVKQWVHMVCGLWTAGTRCPNVDTMSAFDVSDVSHPRENVVCSLCNRRGGSCIPCRVANCSSQFHPWCAHQKGLLQTEAEGVDDENVGFYGRCMLHATYATNESPCDATTIEAGHSEENEASCARTEGYKGRKRDGFWHNINSQSKGKAGCFVHQDQLNAWIHINGLKSCANGLFKLPMLEKEYDYRKEYARFGQAKGWKHLVVYKSGIHALGLYTSRFISRGEMVVEYVGEVVGLRVADKREKEYQSGRRLQYKSACYFFRVDKEYIIDATRKGGIARFVNHSCLPNCIARVISVRNEKKVVFFAERDIYPGEEITYDYHFNHEDEGKKIPCFCNAKNCRRYLN